VVELIGRWSTLDKSRAAGGSYPGHHDFEDRFEIRAVAPPKK
jgi:hypothetical protein